MVRSLSGEDAQSFIDVIDEVRSGLLVTLKRGSLKFTPAHSTRRYWTCLIFHRRSKRSVSDHCTERVGVTHFFQPP